MNANQTKKMIELDRIWIGLEFDWILIEVGLDLDQIWNGLY